MDGWANQALQDPNNDDDDDETMMPNHTAVSTASPSSTSSVPGLRSAVDENRNRPFISYTRTQDGAGLVTEIRALLGMFPKDEMEHLDVQCTADELSSYDESKLDDDDEDDDDDEGFVQCIDHEISMGICDPASSTSMLDMKNNHSLVEGAPPTPPISSNGDTTSSSASSPSKKRLSLPFSLSPHLFSQYNNGPTPTSGLAQASGTGEIQISWSSSHRPTTRSMSKLSVLDPGREEMGVLGSESAGRGMKKCLQLDLRAISEYPLQGAYNLGTSSINHPPTPSYSLPRDPVFQIWDKTTPLSLPMSLCLF